MKSLIFEENKMKEIFVAALILTLGGATYAQSRSGFYELNPAQSVNVKDQSQTIVFNLEAADGAEVYKLRGAAKLIRKNVFEYRKVTKGKTENYDCRILFSFSRGYLTVEENDDCGYDRFPDVALGGRYQLDPPGMTK
jgi:hypothetical protein